jgi:hypothetical protein
MTLGSEKYYTIKAAANLSVTGASTNVDRWRGLPSLLLLDPDDTPGSTPQIHLKQ